MSIHVISQLPEPFTAAIAGDATGIDITHIPRGAPDTVPDDARILLAAPFSRPGDLPARRPAGWPFNIDWVQLVSVGIDFYPPWLFEGPVVTTARGSSSVALAEFALAAIFAHAKHLPDIWIDSPDRWAATPLATVAGTTLGIIGFGSIAEELAPRAQALGMAVIATRRTEAPFPVAGVTRVDTDTLFATADHSVLAAPLTDATPASGCHRIRRSQPPIPVLPLRAGLPTISIAIAPVSRSRTSSTCPAAIERRPECLSLSPPRPSRQSRFRRCPLPRSRRFATRPGRPRLRSRPTRSNGCIASSASPHRIGCSAAGAMT
jgi:hypothetical protein